MKSFLAIVSVFLLSTVPQAFACVGCRQPAVNGADEPQTVLAGVAFSWSVISLLVLVFVVVGGMTAYIAATVRRLDREKNPP